MIAFVLNSPDSDTRMPACICKRWYGLVCCLCCSKYYKDIDGLMLDVGPFAKGLEVQYCALLRRLYVEFYTGSSISWLSVSITAFIWHRSVNNLYNCTKNFFTFSVIQNCYQYFLAWPGSTRIVEWCTRPLNSSSLPLHHSTLMHVVNEVIRSWTQYSLHPIHYHVLHQRCILGNKPRRCLSIGMQ